MLLQPCQGFHLPGHLLIQVYDIAPQKKLVSTPVNVTARVRELGLGLRVWADKGRIMVKLRAV
eukprot:1323907-Amorphochlora_amoeboformis.AAC.1